MEEFSERYFETTIRALTSNSEEFFNVDLSNLQLQAEKLSRLAEALRNNTHLMALDLFGNPLPTSANKGTNNPQIVSHGDNNNNNNSIDNNNRSMNDVFIGWKRLGAVLGMIPVLRELDVGSCLLGDEGIQYLCLGGYLLEHYQRLLFSNTSPLPPSLVTNTILTTLDLSNNRITDNGCDTIALVLKNKPLLVELMLQNNNITACGAIKIAQALSDKVHLNKVWLQQNPIEKSEIERVIFAFKTNFPNRIIQIDNNETVHLSISN